MEEFGVFSKALEHFDVAPEWAPKLTYSATVELKIDYMHLIFRCVPECSHHILETVYNKWVTQSSKGHQSYASEHMHREYSRGVWTVVRCWSPPE
jgi:hypothetical protein